MPPKPHILIVDDEAGIRESLSSILTDEGYVAESAESAERAVERTAHGGLDVILLDVWLPGMDGLEALSRIQTMPHPPAALGPIRRARKTSPHRASRFAESADGAEH